MSANIKNISYKVTREANDFVVEYSFNNKDYHQLRIFNLSFGKSLTSVAIGLYACSPQGEGFKAVFQNPKFIVGLKSIFETGFKRHSEPRLPSTAQINH